MQLLEGDVGLLFTDEQPKVVTEWFETFKKDDYARSGNTVDADFILPEGEHPIPHPSPRALAGQGRCHPARG